MFDTTECTCVVAGLAAVGAIYMSHGRSRMYNPPSACSARQAVVSARAADAEEVEAEPSWSDAFTSTYEGELAPPVLPGGGASSAKVKAARKAVQAQLPLDPKFSKTLGATALVAGRSASETLPKPVVTGGCRMNMSEAYAQELEAIGMDVTG
jgi:hypothetical protein